MPTNQIMFGGNILPCSVERFPDIHKAQRKFRQFNIPGRNGDIFFQSDAYENVIQSYEIYAGGEYGSQEPWTQLARMLYLDGYQELRDTYDPTHFRKAVFNGPIDIENSWNTHGRATIEFNCRPERYLIEGNNSLSFAHQTIPIHWMALDDMSSFIQSGLSDTDAEGCWVVSIPNGAADRKITPNWPNDGQFKSYAYISPGTEATAQSGSFGSTRITTLTRYSTAAIDLLLPDIYFEDQPVIDIDGEVFGAAAMLNNPYMPSYPNIMLHKVAAHSGEEMVFQINDKTVYIDYRSDTPYYFIDTENFSVTCATTLDGQRMPATNVYMSADMKLLSGPNSIFTTEWYDATIVPNWWEL